MIKEKVIEELIEWLEVYCLPTEDCTKAEAIQALRKIKAML